MTLFVSQVTREHLMIEAVESAVSVQITESLGAARHFWGELGHLLSDMERDRAAGEDPTI